MVSDMKILLSFLMFIVCLIGGCGPCTAGLIFLGPFAPIAGAFATLFGALVVALGTYEALAAREASRSHRRRW